jgi:hypothetical protein
MYNVKSSLISVFWHFILILAIGLLTPSRPLWGNDCTHNYPDSDITALLGKAEYQNCTLDVMVNNYGSLLGEEKRLLTALRKVYKRKLDKEVVSERLKKAKSIVRLNDYDIKLSDLSTMEESLILWVEAVNKNPGNDGIKEISQEMKNTLSHQLTKSKRCSQALKRKINRAEDELTSVEKAQFCKLDFYLRVGEHLNPKIERCVKASN